MTGGTTAWWYPVSVRVEIRIGLFAQVMSEKLHTHADKGPEDFVIFAELGCSPEHLRLAEWQHTRLVGDELLIESDA